MVKSSHFHDWWLHPPQVVPCCSAGETWATAKRVNDSLMLWWCSRLCKENHELVVDNFPRNQQVCERSSLIFFPSCCKCGLNGHIHEPLNLRARDFTNSVQICAEAYWPHTFASNSEWYFQETTLFSHEWCSCWRNHITWILWRQFNDANIMSISTHL